MTHFRKKDNEYEVETLIFILKMGFSDYNFFLCLYIFSIQADQEDPTNEPESPDNGLDEGPAPKRTSALVNLLGKTFNSDKVAPRSANTRAEEEMRKYLDVSPLSLSENPLSWWRSHETVFPLLAKLAKHYLCIPGTSVPAERVFSTAGDIVTAQRSTLSAEHVDQLLFLQKNLVLPVIREK